MNEGSNGKSRLSPGSTAKAKLLLLLVIISGWVFAVESTFSQTWVPTGAPSNSWLSVACSADGNKLTAMSASACFTSTNAGQTWVSNNFSFSPVSAELVAASATADHEVSAVTHGIDGFDLAINVSTNGGNSWNQSAAYTNKFHNCWSLVSSASGKNQAISFEGPSVYASTNFGQTWYLLLTMPVFNGEQIQTVTLSADGNTLMVMNGANVCITTNFGGSWVTNNSPQPGAYHAAASADGKKIIAATYSGGQVFTTTNSGVTWTLQTNPPTYTWYNLASSVDGNNLLMAAGVFGSDYYIFTSTDSGVTWVSNNAPNIAWNGVASSADGSKLFAAAQDGGIWTLQTTPAPELNLALANTNLELSWVIPSTNLVLQQSADLASWTDLTNTPALNLTNLRDQVTLWSTGTPAFFRLSSE